ncbi:MAG: sugar-binding protein [Candidatus Brocadiia bacterium]
MRRCGIRRLLVVMFVVFAFTPAVLSAGEPGAFAGLPEAGEAHPWTHLQARNNPDAFQFAVITDRFGGGRPGIYEQAVERLNLLQPEFVVSVGDLIDGYTEDPAVVNTQWDELVDIVERLEMPFFYVGGNHDITNPLMADIWRERFGPSYYHFVYGDVLFLCLNTEDGEPTAISDRQVDYMREALAAHPDARWTFVFMHKPLWLHDSPPVANWQRIEQALAGRPHTVFAGHWHAYRLHEREQGDYYVLATTGGGSELRGALYGEFDHVVWITMADGGPRVANLMLDGIAPKDVRTHRQAEALAALIATGPLAAEPIFADSDRFSSAEVPLILSNPTEFPMEMSVEFPAAGVLQASPAILRAQLEPGASREQTLRLQTTVPVDAADVPVLTGRWEAAVQWPDDEPLSLEGEAVIGVATREDCERADGPMAVDGDLADWGALPISCTRPRQMLKQVETWDGPQDCSFRFGTCYDEQNLYVAVEVVDDALVSAPTRNPWEQDGVEVRVDARPEPLRSAGRGAAEFDQILLLAMSPGAMPDQMVCFGRDLLPEGLQAVCVPTEAGHVTEVAIPAAYLADKAGGEWQAFRLNVAVDDCDDDSGAVAQLWWQPDWRTQANYAGSGTFERR